MPAVKYDGVISLSVVPSCSIFWMIIDNKEYIRLGTPLMVLRREKIGSIRSNWVSTMDATIGCVGIVKALDKRNHQVCQEIF